jgi:hypothetical protein
MPSFSFQYFYLKFKKRNWSNRLLTAGGLSPPDFCLLDGLHFLLTIRLDSQNLVQRYEHTVLKAVTYITWGGKEGRQALSHLVKFTPTWHGLENRLFLDSPNVRSILDPKLGI